MFGRPVDYLTLGSLSNSIVNATNACDSKVGRGRLAFRLSYPPGGGLRRKYYGV